MMAKPQRQDSTPPGFASASSYSVCIMHSPVSPGLLQKNCSRKYWRLSTAAEFNILPGPIVAKGLIKRTYSCPVLEDKD